MQQYRVTSRRLPTLAPVMSRFGAAAGTLAACALLAACGSYHFPGGSTTGSGTVTGQVLAVPCAPVERVDSPCAGRPVSGLAIIFTSDATGEQKTATTDTSGNYALELAAGSWSVSFKGGIMRVISGPKSITVEAGKTVVANYLMDSGIRVPVEGASPPSNP